MKIEVTLKDPDGFYHAVDGAAIEESLRIGSLDDSITEEIQDQIKESKESEINEFLSTWVEYNEYITIVFDTETDTATVKVLKDN
jgi:hypothetical protein